MLINISITIKQVELKEEQEEACTKDGTIDWHRQPAIKAKSGQWTAGIIILCKVSIYIHNMYISLDKL